MTLDLITRVDPSSLGFTLVSSYADLFALLGSNKRIRIAPNTLIPLSASFLLDGLSNLDIEGVGLHSGFDLRGVNFRAFDARNTSKIGFHQLRFVGDFDTLLATRASQGALVTDNASSSDFCSDLIVEGCYFDHLGGDALRIGPNSRGIKIVECTMRGGLGFIEISGVDIGGDTRPVSGVLIAENQVYGTVSGGRTGTLTGSDDMIDCYGGTNDLTIADNFFDLGSTAATTTTNSSGIILLPSTGQGIIRKVDIHDNTFRRFNSTAAGVPGQSAIWAAGDSYAAGFLDLNVHDNIIDDSHFGITVANSTSLGIKVQGNEVATCVRCINIDNSDDVAVSGNVVRHPTDIGIYLQGARPNVCGNHVFLNTSLTGNKTGIWSTTGNQKLIQSNLIAGGPSGCYLIRIVAGDDTRVYDNLAVNSSGTGLDIASGALRTQKRDNFLAGNTTNYANAEATTISMDAFTGSWPTEVTSQLRFKVMLDAPAAAGSNTILWQTDDPVTLLYWALTTVGYGAGNVASLALATGSASDFVLLQRAGGKVGIGLNTPTEVLEVAGGNIKASGKLLGTGGLGVGNSAAATTPGSVVKKIQVYDASGASLGFVAVYDAIT